MEHNRLAELTPQPFSKITQLWGGGSYQEFEYMPDEYERKRVFEMEQKQVAMEKRERVSNHDWRHTSQESRLKHEAMMSDPRSKEVYPYLGGNKEEEMKASKQWSRDVPMQSRSSQEAPKATEGSFLAGKGQGLEDESRTSRMTLPTMVLRLQKRIDADWEGTTVVVSVTDQDLIQVAFHMETVDSERGVTAYMNVLGKDVDLLGSLGLRKVSQLWGMKRDFSAEVSAHGAIQESTEEGSLAHAWMFFLMMPKWVRMRPTDAYYTVRPRIEGSKFLLSTAGSSVLLSLGTSVLDPHDAASEKAAQRQRQPQSQQQSQQSQQSQQWQPQQPPQQQRPPAMPQSARAATGAPLKMDLSLIEQVVGSLPAIRENRGAMTSR